MFNTITIFTFLEECFETTIAAIIKVVLFSLLCIIFVFKKDELP